MNEDLKIWAFLAICLWLIFMLLVCHLVLRRRNQRAIEPTPYTKQGLSQYDDFAPGEAVYLAWSEAGDNPHYHEMMRDDVRAQMPVLGRALDRLVEN